MTQVHFTFESEEIQTIINESGANDTAKTLMTIMFNQLMEEQRNQYIQANEMPMNVQKNGNHKEMVTTIVRLQLELVR